MNKALCVTSFIAMVALAGCAGLGGPSPEEEAMAQCQAMVDDIMAGQVDESTLAYISEDFSHPDVPDKQALADYLEMGQDMGYLDDVPALIEEHDAEIYLGDAEAVLQDDGAVSIYPIDASAIEGAVTVELLWQQDEDGVWRVVGATVEGI